MTITKEKVKTKKPKKHYDSKEPEVFHYFNAKGDKLWGFRHRYYNALGKRDEKVKARTRNRNYRHQRTT